VVAPVQAVQAVGCPAAAQVLTGQVVQVVAPAAEKEPAAQLAQAVGVTPPAPYLPAAQIVQPVSARVSYPPRHLAHLPALPAVSWHLSHPVRVLVQVVAWELMNWAKQTRRRIAI
jgi:hypothetical protein